ncbi:hypothetical protein, partial [Klebsiella aerogenes]|uniref:hypothetical protein n=1 Tax=Klebsiella aerogenes TaxID=548 RepID=UPI001954ED4F
IMGSSIALAMGSVDEYLTFATTRPEPTAASAYLSAAARLPTAISRDVAVATVWDMLVTGLE